MKSQHGAPELIAPASLVLDGGRDVAPLLGREGHASPPVLHDRRPVGTPVELEYQLVSCLHRERGVRRARIDGEIDRCDQRDSRVVISRKNAPWHGFQRRSAASVIEARIEETLQVDRTAQPSHNTQHDVVRLPGVVPQRHEVLQFDLASRSAERRTQDVRVRDVGLL